MTAKEKVVFWLFAYSFIVLTGYSLALAMGEYFFPTRGIVLGVLIGCCVHAIMLIQDWPKGRT